MTTHNQMKAEDAKEEVNKRRGGGVQVQDQEGKGGGEG